MKYYRRIKQPEEKKCYKCQSPFIRYNEDICENCKKQNPEYTKILIIKTLGNQYFWRNDFLYKKGRMFAQKIGRLNIEYGYYQNIVDNALILYDEKIKDILKEKKIKLFYQSPTPLLVKILIFLLIILIIIIFFRKKYV